METRGESLGFAMRDEISGELTVNLGVAGFADNTLSLTFSIRYPVTKTYGRGLPARDARIFARRLC